ncbi:aminotransferase class III-fold pyridoxal phosphate-dependent enzyme [Roseicyclus sp. F158]|uniref:Aminotransferase class III-fold pyridoxal phosphate-dependent enzyme n=1 Tax=Tropicimonas omnivorans TaxID=3075590 RepID=A0ABU3DH59_9RHOB|nr:aminotransferase class III-fold pyridoxal phosphate-dependent enzyme [Roseicyclus sp. F158]MDT0683051.1 aminotransferase class III-fold pyridoxal phosphate-dependent enzyme [Roseicyclus sp. F158]
MNDLRDSNFIKANNARYGWHPMAHPGDMQANPPRIVTAAEGVEVIDIDGHRLLDAVGGLWNVSLGHSAPAVKQAMIDQIERLAFYNTFRGTTHDRVIELSVALREFFAPEGMERAFYTSGGSDSIDTALRLARQYQRIKGQPERTRFFSLKYGYHGTHFGGASINGSNKFRRQYEPMLPGCHHLPAPYPYRNEFGTDDPAAIAQGIAARFEADIAFYGADTIAAFVMEPVLGSGGVIVPHETLMPMMRDICTRNGILLIADEVICAFGRTGSESGSRLWGVQPDMMATAKALTNGFFPLGATLVNGTIAEAFETASGADGTISHGYTNSGHPVGAAAALVTLEEVQKQGVVANAKARGEQLLAALERLKEKHDIVGDVRGKGLMAALELVSDRAAKTPLGKGAVQAMFDAAYEDGVMLRTSGNNIIISPCLVIERADIDRLEAGLDTGLKAAANAA